MRSVDDDLGAAPPPSLPAAVDETWQLRVQRLSRWPERRRRATLDPDNLVPRPAPQYWQNAPAAPFGELCTEAAQGVLACCNIQSSIAEQRDSCGLAAYVCSAGETSFWRRPPTQIAGTLAFMLGRDTAEFGRVRGAGRIRAAEQQPLRECLLWLRTHNP